MLVQEWVELVVYYQYNPTCFYKQYIRDCAIIIRRGGAAEKLELSSKNLDSTPPPKQKKLVLTPLCYVTNNVASPLPPPTHPHTHTHPPLTATNTIDAFK